MQTCFCAAIGLLSLATIAAAADLYLVGPQAYTLQGGFLPSRLGLCASFDRAPPNLLIFSTCGASNPSEGTFRTGSFRAPDVLRFWMAGFPELPGMRVYLEDQDRLRTLDLRSTRNPSVFLRERIWHLPADWRGANVRLIAEDRSHDPQIGWMSLSLPQAGDKSYAFRFARALFRTACLASFAILALLPGIALALYFSTFRSLEAWRVIAWTLVGSGLAAYATFWPYLLTPVAGRTVSIAVPLLSVLAIAWMLRGQVRFAAGVLREVCLCFAITTLVASVSVNSGLLFYTDDEPGEVAQVRYLNHLLPIDNLLPAIVAAHIYYGENIEKIYSAFGVHSSDRPPLQSSFMLMEYPFWVLLTKSLSGYLLAVWLQCAWVAGVWVLLRAGDIGYRSLVPAIAFAALSSFCVMHSFYVWPKLFSAAYCLVALACFPFARQGWHRRRGFAWSFLDGVLAALAVCLSILCHPDCVFTLLALGAVAVVARALPRKSILVVGALIAFCLLAPWKLYRTYYDPTGDTLAKLHLAGSEDGQATLGAALFKAYSSLAPGSWRSAKLEDLAAIGGHPYQVLQSGSARQALNQWIRNTFYSVCFAVGVLWLGLVARFFARSGPVRELADRYLLIATTSIAFWVLIMFQGGATIVHQGSFATMLLLFAALAIYLARAGAQWTVPALAAQAGLYVLFILARPVIRAQPNSVLDGSLDPGMFTVIVLGLLALAFCGRWLMRIDDSETA